jgi:hypothetical protein
VSFFSALTPGGSLARLLICSARCALRLFQRRNPRAMPMMTAIGILTPIPIFAPVERPPDLGTPVTSDVSEGFEVSGVSEANVTVLSCTVGSKVEARARTSASLLCHMMGTPSPDTIVAGYGLCVIVVPRTQLCCWLSDVIETYVTA